jgi:hypothetical protein
MTVVCCGLWVVGCGLWFVVCGLWFVHLIGLLCVVVFCGLLILTGCFFDFWGVFVLLLVGILVHG